MKPEDQPEPAEVQGRDDPDSDAPPSSRLNPGLGLMDSFEPAKLAEGDKPKLSRKQLALRWLKRMTIAVVVLAVLGALAVVGVVEYYSRDLPSVAELKRGYDPPQVTKIYAADGLRAGEPVHGTANRGAPRSGSAPREASLLGCGRRPLLRARGAQLPRHAAGHGCEPPGRGARFKAEAPSLSRS